MNHTLGPQKPDHSLTLEKVLEGKKIEMKVSINSSLTVFVGDGSGYSETAYFEIEDGQEYLRLNNILYIDDVLINKVPITRMEKGTLIQFAIDQIERNEEIKEEHFQSEDAILTFTYNASNRVAEEHEEYPWHVRKRIELLEREELYPFVYQEQWGNEKVLFMIRMPYERLEQITESRMQEKMDSYELRKADKENK
ncbi:hypothetical protein [Bacillus cereus]|uniref:hypothetical protein n=1 Tax=Bacillus cereus TaxID=1396 RepID=UPI001F454108|nr:hypothetical protein [Bacillus cereus]BCC44640.1 hypothetical protein BCJMU01_p217 [Bacillus cereus]